MIVAMGVLNCFLFVVFFAPNRGVLLAGQILCGLCWGVFATLAPSYGKSYFRDRSRSLSGFWPLLTITFASIRGMPHQPPGLLDDIRQSLLGHWATHRLRCAEWMSQHQRRDGIQDPFRHPVGM